MHNIEGKTRLSAMRFTKKLASANLSNLAKSSLRVLTSSAAGQVDENAVKPTMSANNMLKFEERLKEGKSY